MPVSNFLGDLLVEQLDRGASHNALFPVVKAMAYQLTRQGQIPCTKMSEAFTDGSDTEKELKVLFHTIHRKTLRSLVLGFLAYDLYDEDSDNWKHIYAPNGSGTYVIATSIKGRHGLFLSRYEIKELSMLIEKYAVACTVWAKIKDSYGQASQVSQEEEELLKEAMMIDNQLLRKKNQEWSVGDRFREPRCWSGRNGTANAAALIKMLTRRRDGHFDGNVHQAQSPVYVGCAHQIKKRMLAHDPDLSSLAGSSSMLKLMLASIRYMGLKPMVHSVPMVMVWKGEQIPLSEILVTVLAQSLVTQHGLNLIQPGTNSSMDERTTDHHQSVIENSWVRRSWFKENLEKSIGFRSGRPLYQAALDRLNTERLSAGQLRRATGSGLATKRRYSQLSDNGEKRNPESVRQDAAIAFTDVEDEVDRSRETEEVLLGENAGATGNDGGISGLEEDILFDGADDNDDDAEFSDEDFTDKSAIDSQSEDEAPQKSNNGSSGKATPAQKQQKLSQDFFELPPELQTIGQHQAAKLARAADSSKGWVRKHRSQIQELDILEGWIPTAEDAMKDGTWTQQQEDVFQQGLQDDPYLQYLQSVSIPRGNKGFIPMWKKICKLRRCFPTSIISPLNYLEYHGRVTLADGTQAADPVWTRGFSDRLVRLTLGGPWGTNITLLTLFIRYAVACRINDRRAVPFAHETDSKFLDTMRMRLYVSRDSSKSIPQIHKEVRRGIEATGLALPWYSVLMRNIKKVAYSQETEAHRGGEDEGAFSPYRVLTEDLHCVDRAVHHCKDLGRPMFASVGDSARLLSHERGGYDFPKTEEDMRYLLCRIYVAQKRHMEIEPFSAPSQSSSG
ncbi:hypothetical protein DL765_011629 [Monosporascus sp. GIB2]|nr:hypothetical protein DL765_011629 [Monosporascus sp. GIB2]